MNCWTCMNNCTAQCDGTTNVNAFLFIALSELPNITYIWTQYVDECTIHVYDKLVQMLIIKQKNNSNIRNAKLLQNSDLFNIIILTLVTEYLSKATTVILYMSLLLSIVILSLWPFPHYSRSNLTPFSYLLYAVIGIHFMIHDSKNEEKNHNDNFMWMLRGDRIWLSKFLAI